MIILGLGQIGGLDSSVALLRDGEVRYALAEERLDRRKHSGGFPTRALRDALDREGIGLEDVDHVAIVDRPWMRFRRRTFGWYGRKLLSHPQSALYHVLHDEVPTLFRFLKARRRLRRDSLGRARIHFVEHHRAHMASAFLVSPFEEAAVLSYDARGEVASTVLGVGRGRRVERIAEARMPDSLGVFYAGITDYLGFRFGEDEYKVMGLASYGEPEYLEDLRRLVRFDPRRLLRTDLSWFTYQNGRGFFSPRFTRRFGAPRGRGEPIEDRHRNLAASAQALLEEIALALVRHLHERTGLRDLCMAGGVALNCVANGRIAREGPFERLYVQPAAGDDGGSLGAALHVRHEVLGEDRDHVMRSATLGPEFGEEEIEQALEIAKAPYRRAADICVETARHLAEGRIVGWYQGREEFGPRALGSRSILADPSRPDMRDEINRCVKFREDFRPFAPSAKAERAAEYFELDAESPFMLLVCDVRPEHRDTLPAITHVDGTARVQTVDRELEPLYWRLIDEFEKRTGLPVLLNTSFNVMGEPIVHTPGQAIRCFYGSGLDVLAIGPYLVRKPGGDP